MNEEVYIRDYFNGKLSPKEHEQFEARYQEDHVFRTQADKIEVEVLAIRAQARKELKERFASWTEEEQTTPVIDMAAFWKMGIAASVLLLLGVTYWFWPTPNRGADLFNRYYEPYENFEITVSRGETNEQATPLVKGFKAYDEYTYQSAIDWFGQVRPNNRQYGAVLFFKGVAHIEIDQLEKASKAFQQVIDRQDPDYEEAATWYQALIWVKQDRGSDARPLLYELVSSKSEYQEQAQSVLHELD